MCACDGAFKDYVWPTHPMYIQGNDRRPSSLFEIWRRYRAFEPLIFFEDVWRYCVVRRNFSHSQVISPGNFARALFSFGFLVKWCGRVFV